MALGARDSHQGSAGKGGEGNYYRVMVVDDSAVIRGILVKMLEEDPHIKVLESANNGQRALSALPRHDFDVILLDIEMPVMDGLTALPKILEVRPNVKVVIASTLTRKNAEISLRCLQAGASDYIAKPGRGSELATAGDFRKEIVNKVKELGAARRRSLNLTPVALDRAGAKPAAASIVAKASPTFGANAPAKAPAKALQLRQGAMTYPNVIAIGSSTGGPQALNRVFETIKGVPIRLPIFITQHMPATFTSLLAQHIGRTSGRPCHEGAEGMAVEAGSIYVAPGGQHMTVVSKNGQSVIRLLQTPPENFCRPSVDPMLRSLVSHYGPRILFIMLTGMGADGLNSARELVEAGGTVVAQDEETSVVWGMPGAVAQAGLCSAVLPLGEIGRSIQKIIMRSAA